MGQIYSTFWLNVKDRRNFSRRRSGPASTSHEVQILAAWDARGPDRLYVGIALAEEQYAVVHDRVLHAGCIPVLGQLGELLLERNVLLDRSQVAIPLHGAHVEA